MSSSLCRDLVSDIVLFGIKKEFNSVVTYIKYLAFTRYRLLRITLGKHIKFKRNYFHIFNVKRAFKIKCVVKMNNEWKDSHK